MAGPAAQRPARGRLRPAALAVLALLTGTGPGLAANASMTVFDFHHAGQFTVHVPWRLDPTALSLPILVHGYFGYTWLLKEQVDLIVRGIDVEVDGRPLSVTGGPHTFTFPPGESVVRRAGSGRPWWYRILEVPAGALAPGRTSRLRVRIHRAGRATRPLVPVPPIYGRPPDMRVRPGDSPYEGEEPGWYQFHVHRSTDPLPVLPGLYGGDTHVHTEYTHHVAEFGGPLEMYAAAARAMGIDWATFTDHGNSFDSLENLRDFNRGATHPPFGPRDATRLEAKWEEFIARTRALEATPGRRFVGIVGAELDVRPPCQTGPCDYFCHLLIYGHARPVPSEGPNGIDWRVAGITLKRAERGMSGRGDVFGVDTVRVNELLADLKQGRYGALYGPELVVAALAHPINRQAWFTPNPFHMGVWWRWGFDDEPDELPAFYAPAPDRLRVGAFQIMNTNNHPYAQEIDPSIPYWDSIISEGLRMRPPRRNAVIGGSDAHGDLSSAAVRESVVGLGSIRIRRTPDGSGFGSARTLAACPAGLSAGAVLSALRDGRTVATNGPALLTGIDVDADGRLDPGHDVLPSTREGDEALWVGDGPLHATVVWRSSAEFGPVEEVRLVLGTPTGARTVWTGHPSPAGGLDGRSVVRLAAAGMPEWLYLRAECATRRGQDVVREGRLRRRVERRAYTSPVWVRRVPATSP